VEDNIKRTRDTLILEALLPVIREGKDEVSIAVQDIEIALKLRRVDLVAIDPHLEVTRDATLANLLEELCNDRHIVVDHNDVRLLLADDLGELEKAEALTLLLLRTRLFERSRIDRLNIAGVGAIIRGDGMKLLEAEVRNLHPRELRKLLDNAPCDLAVTGKLVTVGTNKHKLKLALISLAKNKGLRNTLLSRGRSS